ncbi:hypothetical protein A2U01_0028378, partial [Trifolium medium]|nr:hypothetical protein [Trifolium medium]
DVASATETTHNCEVPGSNSNPGEGVQPNNIGIVS